MWSRSGFHGNRYHWMNYHAPLQIQHRLGQMFKHMKHYRTWWQTRRTTHRSISYSLLHVLHISADCNPTLSVPPRVMIVPILSRFCSPFVTPLLHTSLELLLVTLIKSQTFIFDFFNIGRVQSRKLPQIAKTSEDATHPLPSRCYPTGPQLCVNRQASRRMLFSARDRTGGGRDKSPSNFAQMLTKRYRCQGSGKLYLLFIRRRCMINKECLAINI